VLNCDLKYRRPERKKGKQIETELALFQGSKKIQEIQKEEDERNS
jgi:hypothetical protein